MYKSVVTELIFNNAKVERIIKPICTLVIRFNFYPHLFTTSKDQKCLKIQILLHFKNWKESKNENRRNLEYL